MARTTARGVFSRTTCRTIADAQACKEHFAEFLESGQSHREGVKTRGVERLEDGRFIEHESFLGLPVETTYEISPYPVSGADITMVSTSSSRAAALLATLGVLTRSDASVAAWAHALDVFVANRQHAVPGQGLDG